MVNTWLYVLLAVNQKWLFMVCAQSPSLIRYHTNCVHMEKWNITTTPVELFLLESCTYVTIHIDFMVLFIIHIDLMVIVIIHIYLKVLFIIHIEFMVLVIDFMVLGILHIVCVVLIIIHIDFVILTHHTYWLYTSRHSTYWLSGSHHYTNFT
jgi:hypothetical protein